MNQMMLTRFKADFTGAVKVTKNSAPDKYSYSEYGIGFDFGSYFSILNSQGKSVVIFETDNSSSVSIDNKKSDIGQSQVPTQ